jgi:hypothetical protein
MIFLASINKISYVPRNHFLDIGVAEVYIMSAIKRQDGFSWHLKPVNLWQYGSKCACGWSIIYNQVISHLDIYISAKVIKY